MKKKTKRRSTHFSHEYDSIIIYTYKLKLRIFVAVTDTLLIEGLNICAENSPDFGWGGKDVQLESTFVWLEKRGLLEITIFDNHLLRQITCISLVQIQKLYSYITLA